jgi:hypothetical protein
MDPDRERFEWEKDSGLSLGDPVSSVSGFSFPSMQLIICLPLLLVLLGGRAVGKHAAASPSQCFTSHLSKSESWKACCDGATSGTIDLGDTTFDYTCNSFLSPHEEFAGLGFYNAYECANACVETEKCEAAFWDSKNNKCFYAASHSQKITMDKYFTIQNKRPTTTRNRPQNEPADCQSRVDRATIDCQSMERKQCEKRIQDQKQLLRGQCDQRWTETCNEEKRQLTEQFQQDQAVKEETNRRALQKLQDEIDQLKKQDEDQKSKEKQGPGRTKDDNVEPEPRGSSDSQRSQVPSGEQWKCPEQDGKEYTVLGVTYKVFCNSQPSGRAMAGGSINTKHPEFLMAMCSVDSNCQGIRAKSSSAELVRDYEYPPKQESKYTGWWSIVPVTQKSDKSAMVPDLFSRSPDGNTAPGAASGAACPSIDGQILAVGDNEFQVNCRNAYRPRRAYGAPIAQSFRQCLVMCTIHEGCQGVRYTGGCWLIYEHEKLEKSTPKSQLSSLYLAMLTVPRGSSDGGKN